MISRALSLILRRRRWLAAAAGIALTGAMGWSLLSDPGVYWSRTRVVFMLPDNMTSNPIQANSAPLVVAAGTVAKRVTGPSELPQYASPDVTLVGVGIHDGWSVRLPDNGGQWAPHFNEQDLIVEVVGPSEEVVRERTRELIMRIHTELAAAEGEFQVRPDRAIHVKNLPTEVEVVHVEGSTTRALAMTGFLGANATVAAIVLVGRGTNRTRIAESQTEPADGPE